jgi:hypothetical protein
MGLPFFPNLPNVPGIPALPRIPAPVFGDISLSLGSATNVMRQVGNLAALAPNTAMSAVLDQVNTAQGLVASSLASLTQYPSTLFNNFVAPVTNISGSLNGIAASIVSNPSGPISDISSDVDDVTSDLSSTSGDYDDQSASITDPPQLDSDVESVTVTAVRNQWGIFKDGQAVVIADNVVSVDFKQDWNICDYPIQQGGFESYNKVYVPFDVRVRFSTGGSVARRGQFLDSIDAIAPTLDLYDVVTPEKTFTSCNVTHQGYGRTAREGAGLIMADIWLVQVNQEGSATFSNTASPASQDAVNGGTVQPAAPTPTQAAALPGTM